MSIHSSEFEYINWIRSQTGPSARVLVGPGDDAAVLKLASDRACLATTDMLMDGTDFRLAEVGPFQVGRKALAVNLSDIAAMAGRPTCALVSVALPKKDGRQIAEGLFDGINSLAHEFAVDLVGGDTNSWDGPLVISITLLGEATEKGPVLRSGARPGDWLFVTGPLGGSILGKHLTFVPRIREALKLHEHVQLKAMIDISDGFGADLGHICVESGCGAVVRADAIPISADAKRMRDTASPLEHALADGEDFELLFAVSPEDGARVVSIQPTEGLTLAHIGECVDSGLWLEVDGLKQALAPKGYVHLLE